MAIVPCGESVVSVVSVLSIFPRLQQQSLLRSRLDILLSLTILLLLTALWLVRQMLKWEFFTLLIALRWKKAFAAPGRRESYVPEAEDPVRTTFQAAGH